MTTSETVWTQTQTRIAALKKEIGRVIVGQEDLIEEMLVALLCKGHCLIVGVPGLAKTLLVSTLGRILGLTFHRIQFTPDLMPTDILGSEILQEDPETGHRRFQFVPGPVFANLILADEINRTPPKTQAALLEAMQEKQVTVSGKSLALKEPFMVFATQNPIEHEGTYPLPEAQLDRFFFCLNIAYPSSEEERQIVLRTTAREAPASEQILEDGALLALQEAVLDVPLPEHVLAYIVRLVQASRPDSQAATDYIKKYVAWGAGPRASQTFTRSAKALAALRGHPGASVEEVQAVALPVLRHRIIPNYNATGEGVSVEDIVKNLLDSVPRTT
ncbi:MAG TPA: AAA family ATPase [Verrucomicrobia bacterium]|nr:MAG: AAA family ATPase [Lentisphaerae bacterium GWF2_57_35]HBA83641.1 AAA family ATPase [Verrucomicrobiota bacterium]